MNPKYSAVIALLIVGALPALSLISWSEAPEYTEEQAVFIATQFLKESPTFKFDGVPESISLVSANRARTPVPTWAVALNFTSLNAGYGDRNDMMLAEVITSHMLSVIVEEGEVISAVIDGDWDVFTQTLDKEFTLEKATETALEFMQEMPTYAYDGIADTVEVVGVEPLRMLNTWEVTVSFTSRHGGYGDREGMMLTQVLTPHTTRIVVSEGVVIGAVTDEAYDELRERELPVSELIPPEWARDLAVTYIIENYDEAENLEFPTEWEVFDLTPEGLLGRATVQYKAGGWTVNVTFAVVMAPVYTVSVEYGGEDLEFTWTGTVDQAQRVTVEETTLTESPDLIIAPEEAKDLTLEYIFENSPEMETAEKPTFWAFEVMTPTDLVGFQKIQYVSGDWEVNVSAPVVLHPTYMVEVAYSGEPEFSGAYTVQPDGTVALAAVP